MLQDLLVPVRVLEGHVLKADIAPDGLPVLLFGLKAVAVNGGDLGAVVYIRPGLQESGEPFDIHLGGDQVGDGIHDPPDRLHHALGIGHEHGEGADLGLGDDAALPEHDGQGQGGGEVHGDGEGAPQPGGAHALAAHGGRVGDEGLLHLLLDHQGLDGPGAGDALVEVAGDLGVQLPDLPVGLGETCLKQAEEQHRQGQHCDDQQGESGVDGKHHHHRAHHIADLPEAFQHGPGHQGADTLGIGHDPGVDVTHAVLVVVGEGQGLQMGEGGVAQVPVHPHLDLHAVHGGDVVEQRAAADQREIEDHEEHDGVQGPLADEVVQGIALEEGDAGIHQASHKASQDHEEQGLLVVFQVGQHLADAEELQVLLSGGLVFHADTSSALADWISQIF